MDIDLSIFKPSIIIGDTLIISSTLTPITSTIGTLKRQLYVHLSSQDLNRMIHITAAYYYAEQTISSTNFLVVLRFHYH